MSDTEGPNVTGQNLDRQLHAWLGRVQGGLSPASITAAFMDWAAHLANSPGKQQQLIEKAARKLLRLMLYARSAALSNTARPPGIEPLPQDQRFVHPGWQQWPFDVIYQSFLLFQQWCYNATTGIRGVTPHHEQVVTFVLRQLLDTVSPSNFVLTNPEVLIETMRSGGGNLMRGAGNLGTDWLRTLAGKRSEQSDGYHVGVNVAVTPGTVVLRNRLIELIQYAPGATTVHPEPVLIVPSWIMKYYVLDLSRQNSLVKYFVDQGHTVFMISWKNPDAEDRDLSMDDYLRSGVMAALDCIAATFPKHKIHAGGYCLGGTLLAIAAAAMARDNDNRLASLTLLAAETDFSEPGELSLFMDESQVAYLEDIMWDQGYLDGKQMANAFTLLNSKDLLWSRMVHDYLMGNRRELTDLMAWNEDATRLPYRMHSEYLRRLYLNNDLAYGRFPVGDRPVALGDIRLPMFAVGTERDHVSPWKSVYKIHLLCDSEITFVLTNGGHNAGIVAGLNHPRRTYRIGVRQAEGKYVDPDTWLASAEPQAGSWWKAWHAWLAQRSSPRVRAPAKSAKAPLGRAPGSYVLAA